MCLSLTMYLQMAFNVTVLALLCQRSHFLMSLLCLESMLLTMVLYIPTILHMTNITIPTLSIVLLTFGACEASLGLSILVLMSRSHGSDMMNSMTTNKW